MNIEIANLKEELKSKNEVMDDENYNKSLKELEELKMENELLKSSLEDANKIIARFVEGEKNLNMILSQQRLMLDKGGIGYNGERKDRSYKSYFVRATHNTRNYCRKMGHIAHTCAIRNNMNRKIKGKYVWVPKGQVYFVKTNLEGLKHKWVSKI